MLITVKLKLELKHDYKNLASIDKLKHMAHYF